MVQATSTRRSRPLRALLYLALALVSATCVGPILYLFVAALKPTAQIIRDMSSILAFVPYGELSLANFDYILNGTSFWLFFRNSVLSSLLAMSLSVLVCGMMGYALGMLRFRGRATLVNLVIAMLIVPAEAVIINQMLVVNALGLINKLLALVLPFLANPLFIFLFYQHFRDMPQDLAQAAVIDGAGYQGIFWRIMLPLSKPVISTVAIFSFLWRWGDLTWPVMVTRNDSIRTLPLAMQTFYGSNGLTAWGNIFALGVLMTLPVLIVFILFQRQFIQSVASAGIKG